MVKPFNARLAQDVYQFVYENTESFRVNDIGVQLAYLLGAILNEGSVEYSKSQADASDHIMAVLRGFPRFDKLMKFICIDFS